VAVPHLAAMARINLRCEIQPIDAFLTLSPCGYLIVGVLRAVAVAAFHYGDT
jgi:hypothetical protein